jgi:lipopolysaccharide heptosyltransferase II
VSRLPPDLLPSDVRLLFRAPNWVGDAALSLPALEALRRWRPDAHVVVATRRAALSLFVDHPAVNGVLELPARRDRDRGAVRAMGEGNFGAALLLSPSFRSAYQVWRARVPVRIGYAREMRRPLLSHPLGRRGTRPAAHQVREYLDLAEATGARAVAPMPRLAPGAQQLAIANQVLQGLPEGGRSIVGIGPFTAGDPTKRWPARHVRRLLALLVERGLHPLILGGPDDGPRARRLVAPVIAQLGPAAISVRAGASAVPLLPLAALAARVPVLVTVDTGPMHVWAAGGGRVVAIFGSSLPGLHGPVGAGHRVLHRGDLPCAGCYHRSCPHGLECLEGISAEQALAAVLDVMDDGR